MSQPNNDTKLEEEGKRKKNNKANLTNENSWKNSNKTLVNLHPKYVKKYMTKLRISEV